MASFYYRDNDGDDITMNIGGGGSGGNVAREAYGPTTTVFNYTFNGDDDNVATPTTTTPTTPTTTSTTTSTTPESGLRFDNHTFRNGDTIPSGSIVGAGCTINGGCTIADSVTIEAPPHGRVMRYCHFVGDAVFIGETTLLQCTVLNHGECVKVAITIGKDGEVTRLADVEIPADADAEAKMGMAAEARAREVDAATARAGTSIFGHFVASSGGGDSPSRGVTRSFGDNVGSVTGTHYGSTSNTFNYRFE